MATQLMKLTEINIKVGLPFAIFNPRMTRAFRVTPIIRWKNFKSELLDFRLHGTVAPHARYV